MTTRTPAERLRRRAVLGSAVATGAAGLLTVGLVSGVAHAAGAGDSAGSAGSGATSTDTGGSTGTGSGSSGTRSSKTNSSGTGSTDPGLGGADQQSVPQGGSNGS